MLPSTPSLADETGVTENGRQGWALRPGGGMWPLGGGPHPQGPSVLCLRPPGASSHAGSTPSPRAHGAGTVLSSPCPHPLPPAERLTRILLFTHGLLLLLEPSKGVPLTSGVCTAHFLPLEPRQGRGSPSPTPQPADLSACLFLHSAHRCTSRGPWSSQFTETGSRKVGARGRGVEWVQSVSWEWRKALGGGRR